MHAKKVRLPNPRPFRGRGRCEKPLFRLRAPLPAAIPRRLQASAFVAARWPRCALRRSGGP
eukprot:4245546-Alexandrium_andersonii.AAC.1